MESKLCGQNQLLTNIKTLEFRLEADPYVSYKYVYQITIILFGINKLLQLP